jgi:hypothetical protein
VDINSCPVSAIASFSRCGSLHSLVASGCSKLSGRVELSPSPAAGASLEGEPREGLWPKLTFLNLKDCTGIAALSGLDRCPVLNTLNVSGCTQLTGVAGMASTSLHTLTMKCCSSVADVEGISNLPNLHTLNMSACGCLVTLEGLQECGALHTIDLSFCYGIGDVDVLAECPKLHRLNLRGCSGVMQEGLRRCGLAQRASLMALDLLL